MGRKSRLREQEISAAGTPERRKEVPAAGAGDFGCRNPEAREGSPGCGSRRSRPPEPPAGCRQSLRKRQSFRPFRDCLRSVGAGKEDGVGSDLQDGRYHVTGNVYRALRRGSGRAQKEETMKSDIQIAQEATMNAIVDVAAKLDIREDELELYGAYKAKLSDELMNRVTQ